MNKVFCRKRRFFSCFPAGCLILFNLFLFTACGLDTFYVINAPSRIGNEPTYASIDEADNFLEFYTKVEDQNEGIRFLGTDVYYKIYTDSSRLNSEHSSIMQLANSENTSNQAADRMIISYRFQPLFSSKKDSEHSVLIKTPEKKEDREDRKVRIRLVNFEPFEKAQITVSGNEMGIPLRSIPNNPSFDFFAQSAETRPKNDDADANISTSSAEPEEYYVSMFAVAVGQDNTYARLYSNVLYLGSVKISKR